jgi:putative ABC transport system substrate-binding protein
MQRREFITLLGGGGAFLPLVAHAQQRMPLVMIVMSLPESDGEAQARVKAFRDALSKLGWMEGRNVRFDHRWNVSGGGREKANAAELAQLSPQVVLAQGSPNTQAIARELRTTPVVFVGVSDPLGSGLVSSLARPSGNVTGFVNYEFSIAAKWLELLKELVPGTKRVLVIVQPHNIGNLGLLRAVEQAGGSLGTDVTSAGPRNWPEIESVIDAFVKTPHGGLILPPNNIAFRERDRIVAMCARLRLPAVYGHRPYAEAGGLVSYSTDLRALYARAASYVDRILRGESPGNLPVQQPTRFELAVNLKAAKAIGLAIPEAFLARADEVIE